MEYLGLWNFRSVLPTHKLTFFGEREEGGEKLKVCQSHLWSTLDYGTLDLSFLPTNQHFLGGRGEGREKLKVCQSH